MNKYSYTRCVVLDVMGVIFKTLDDVEELLIPFVNEFGGREDILKSTYLKASLGQIDTDEFWQIIGIDPTLEDTYLSRHSILPGVIDFLKESKIRNIPIWCLSNDLGRWSKKLRRIFQLDEYIEGAIISGDVKVRKPDPAIYQALFEQSGYEPKQLLFIDDRYENTKAAETLGMPSILFEPSFDLQTLYKQILGKDSPS